MLCRYCGSRYDTRVAYKGKSPCCPSITCYGLHGDVCRYNKFPRDYPEWGYGITYIDAYEWKVHDYFRLKIRAVKHLFMIWLLPELSDIVLHYMHLIMQDSIDFYPRSDLVSA